MPRTTRDAVRHYRAKPGVMSGGADNLMKRAETRVQAGWDKLAHSDDAKFRARMLLYGTAYSLCGGVGYVVMIYLWFRVYHKYFNSALLTFVGLLGFAALGSMASRKRVAGKDRLWLRFGSTVFAFSVIVGLIVGFFLYFRSLAYYWRYQDLRTYTNVAASQTAQAFNDASMFLWTEDSRLDPMRSVGFRSKWTGGTYCVAPIVDGTMSQIDPIYYWAVGDGCCNARSDFHCDDAADDKVRSALILLEPEDVVRPWMTWAVRGAVYPRYLNAVRLQEATYSTKAASKFKMVYWTKDPIALKDAFYTDAVWRCVWVSLVYFFLMEFAACYAWAKHLQPARKPEPSFREKPTA